MTTLEDLVEITNTLRSEVDQLKFDFTIGIIIISIVVFLSLVLSAILYGWMYTMEKKVQKINHQDPEEIKIRRPQIRDANSPQLQSLSGTQNPLAKSNNYTAVVDDLKKNSTIPNTQQGKYPNYIEDNNNFSF